MILLIGYGNDLRRDDGAGLVLAEIIERAWQIRGVAVKRLAVHQLMPELAVDIAGPEVSAVVFVDTRAAAADEVSPDVQVQRVPAGPSSPSLGHHLDPAALLTYAGHLYGRRPPAWLVTVPGTDFSYGEGLSRSVQEALAAVPTLPFELLACLQAAAVPS